MLCTFAGVFQRMPSKQRDHAGSGSSGDCASRMVTVHLYYQFVRHFLPAEYLAEIRVFLEIAAQSFQVT